MRHLIRLATVIFSLMLTSVFIPGFVIYQFQTAFVIGIIIALVGWIIESILWGEISPFARAVIGVIVTAGMLSLFSITNLVSLNLLGLVVTSLLTGTVDLFFPTYAHFTE